MSAGVMRFNTEKETQVPKETKRFNKRKAGFLSSALFSFSGDVTRGRGIKRHRLPGEKRLA